MATSRETEFSLVSRTGTRLLLMGFLFFMGAAATFGGDWNLMGPDLPPFITLILCWSIAYVVSFEKRTTSASLSSDKKTVFVRVNKRQWSFNVDSIDYICIRNNDPDNPGDLFIVFKDQSRQELLDDDPVEEFGIRLAQLVDVRWSRE